MGAPPTIYLTQDDFDRLFALLDSRAREGEGGRFEKLEAELLRAEIVPPERIPGDVVTMNSRVLFEDETTGERREVTLAFPWDADIAAGKISVLVPVGTALLGLRVGQTIDWVLPSGEKRRYRIIAVPYQPEASAAG